MGCLIISLGWPGYTGAYECTLELSLSHRAATAGRDALSRRRPGNLARAESQRAMPRVLRVTDGAWPTFSLHDRTAPLSKEPRRRRPAGTGDHAWHRLYVGPRSLRA